MVAPATSQSATGAKISYGGTLAVSQPDPTDPKVWVVAGSPADSMAFALSAVYSSRPPDLVISGANFGQNTSRNTNHSGTFGAVTEALERGIPSIAVSSVAQGDYDGRSATLPDFPNTATFVTKLVAELQAAASGRLLPRGLGLNVNYPLQKDKGVRLARFAEVDPFPTTYTFQCDGMYAIGWQYRPSGEKDVDTTLLEKGFVTITPIDCDLSSDGDLSGARAQVQALVTRLV